MTSKLKIVTLTGADDSVDPKTLYKLLKDYPFVEAGILLSGSKQGTTPRFPSVPWMNEFSTYPIKRCAHICGGWARAAIELDYEVLSLANILLRKPDRMQLNVSPYLKRTGPKQLHEYCSIAILGYVPNLIIQTGNPASLVLVQGLGLTPECQILDDKSGGLGIDGEFTAPVFEDRMAGFAGGITPENVQSKIEGLLAMHFWTDFWIDMESGVRTDDKFDLDKAEAVLKIAKMYVR